MKNLNHRIFGIFLASLMIFFMMRCASKPVSVDLPANHPANAQAEETAFNPPPNLFKNNNPAVVHQSESNSSMTHEAHQSAQPHQMNPKMDKMGRGSDASQAFEAQDPEHEHKENHQ